MVSFKQWLEAQNSAGATTDPAQVRSSATDTANQWLGDPNNADEIGGLQSQMGNPSRFQPMLNKFGALATRKFGTQGMSASPLDVGAQIAKELLPRAKVPSPFAMKMRRMQRKRMKQK